MSASGADIVDLQEDLPDLPLHPEVPGLYIRRSVPVADRAAHAKTQPGKQSLGTSRRQLRTGRKRIRDPGGRSSAVIVVCQDERCIKVVPLKSSIAGAGRFGLRRVEEDSVSGADHEIADSFDRPSQSVDQSCPDQYCRGSGYWHW